MKLFISFLILSLSRLAFGFDFYQYSPSKKIIDGETYPRNSYTKYRGTTEHQMSLTKALRAMFLDESAYLESFFFTKIKLELMGQTVPFEYEISYFLKKKIREKIKSNGAPLDKVAATRYAKFLVDDHFDYHIKDDRNWAINLFIDYDSETYIDWPKKVVFSSIVSPSAGTYGNRMVIIDEKIPRSLDMNYWNQINKGKWFDHTRDAGEFLAPGYIPYSDIIGYEIRIGKEKRWWEIDLIFYQEFIDGEPVVLIFDGEMRDCAMKTDKGEYVFCSFRWRDSFAEGPRPPTKYKLPILGVISKKEGIELSELKKRFTLKSDKKLPDWVKREIKAVSGKYLPL